MRRERTRRHANHGQPVGNRVDDGGPRPDDGVGTDRDVLNDAAPDADVLFSV